MKVKYLLILAFFLCSCQTMPVINKSDQFAACPSPFLKQKYRLVHAIEARMPGDVRNAVIGVTVADPRTRSISSAIMTAEGMVLFEAESSTGKLMVKRALPPFDASGFAENMLNDIKLTFFRPEGKIQTRGYLPDGESVCRYQEANGEWVDVMEGKAGGPQIKSYSSSGALKRIIRFDKAPENPYQHIELEANKTFGYSLIMTLIEAQPVRNKK